MFNRFVQFILLGGLFLLLAACLPAAQSPNQPTPIPVETTAVSTPTLPVLPTVAPTTTPEPNAAQLPASCLPQPSASPELGPHLNLRDGYCFQYPVQLGFQVSDVFVPGVSALWGQPLTLNTEPVRAGLSVYKRGPANGQTLDEIVAETLTFHPDARVADANATFAGEPAQLIEGLQGQMDSSQLILLHEGSVYTVSLVPFTPPAGFESAVLEQRTQVWEAVSSSFTWLPAEAAQPFATCPVAEENGRFPNVLYVHPTGGYCLLMTGHYRHQTLADGTAIFNGSAVDPFIPEPVRASVWIGAPEPANGRSLTQVVDELIASYPGTNIIATEITLGGTPAVQLEGLPNVGARQDIFAIHDERVYHLQIGPFGFEPLAEELSQTRDLLLTSFHFFP